MIKLIKNTLFLSLFALLIVLSQKDISAVPSEDVNKSSIFLNEISVGSGHVHGSLENSPDGYSVYPGFVRVGLNINSLVGMEGRQSTLQLAFESFVNSINGKKAGVETGCSLGIRYFYTISRSVDLFTEGSIAPMFLGIDTIEQGESGFNFLDQIGGGLQYKLFKIALFAGYRFRHISNARFVNRPNEGINSNALIGGFSWLF